MQGIKYFPQDLNIEGKRIIVRVDLNVPLKDKKIQDSTRIEQTLPFLNDLVKRKSKSNCMMILIYIISKSVFVVQYKSV